MLAISKQLVALMEGKMGVESEPDKDSTFWFTAQLGKQTDEAETRETSAPDQLDMRVLVVDDNHTNRQILLNQVGAWKMEVGSVASGNEALDRLRAAARRPTVRCSAPGCPDARNGWLYVGVEDKR
jgi:two-component system, sensor histidine kinase and response regulator